MMINIVNKQIYIDYVFLCNTNHMKSHTRVQVVERNRLVSFMCSRQKLMAMEENVNFPH